MVQQARRCTVWRHAVACLLSVRMGSHGCGGSGMSPAANDGVACLEEHGGRGTPGASHLGCACSTSLLARPRMSSSSWSSRMVGTSLQTKRLAYFSGMHNGCQEEEAGEGGWT